MLCTYRVILNPFGLFDAEKSTVMYNNNEQQREREWDEGGGDVKRPRRSGFDQPAAAEVALPGPPQMVREKLNTIMRTQVRKKAKPE
jgi:hypothetical protein